MKLGTFHTPPRNQGQIVEVSYTQVDGMVIRRTYDRSDRSTQYEIALADADDQGDYWNGSPHPTDDWRPLTEQEQRWAKEEFGIDVSR